jgi:predicted DNA-binding transcriptional regulator AlpA
MNKANETPAHRPDGPTASAPAAPASTTAAIETPYLRTEDASALCGLPVASLTTLRSRGGGPVFLKVGRRVVYRRADLQAWMESNPRKSTSDPGPTGPTQ